jgi:hypothetical protein
MVDLLEIKDAVVVEGDLRSVATEDGEAFYPDLQVIAYGMDGKTYIHPHLFVGSINAYNDAHTLADRTWAIKTIDPDIWNEIQDREFTYSKGNNEPYDSEEEYYIGSM